MMEDHVHHLVLTLLSFQQRSLFCDTVIATKDRLLYAHSAVLAATCPTMFNLLNQQPFSNQNTNVIQLEKFDSNSVEELLSFLYTGQLDASRVFELQEICDLLGIKLSLSDAECVGVGSVLVDEDSMIEVNHSSKLNSEMCKNKLGRGSMMEGTKSASMVSGLRAGKSVGHVDSSKGDELASDSQTQNRKSCLRATKSEITKGNCSSILRKPTEVERSVGNVIIPKKPIGNFRSTLPIEPREFLKDFQPLKLSEKRDNIMQSNNLMNSSKSNSHSSSNKTVRFKYTCSLCEVQFETQRALNIHKYSHNLIEDGKYQCHICSKTFTVRDYLRKHVRAHYSVTRKKQAKKYSCPTCQKKFRTAARLNSHANMHTGEKPFLCVICGKGYADKEYLVKHQRLHSNEKPYLCDDCGLRFAFRQSYTSHRKLHTGEKPYVCSECKRTFSQSSSLRTHLQSHTRPSSLTCSQCLETFPSAKRFAAHILLAHTADNRRQFRCTQCHKSFLKHYLLLQHLQVHNRSYECRGCGSKFQCQLKLRQHNKSCNF